MNYLGNKTKLNDFIYGSVKDFINEKDEFNKKMTFYDLFSGTGSVSKYWSRKGFKVSSNDIQFYSFVKLNSLLNNKEVDKIKIDKLFGEINKLDTSKLKAGFITKNYSPFGKQTRMFFTIDNALLIDYSINLFKKLRNNQKLSEEEWYFCVSKLIDSASKVSNTAVVYEAYLKSFKPSSIKRMILINDIDDVRSKRKHNVFNKKIEDLILKVKGDILYLDPPYNSRGYDSNYHLLETIAIGDEPEIRNVSGRRNEENKKSLFALKSTAKESMDNLLQNANFKYIFISYNNEGIITPLDFEEIAERNNWELKVYTKKYKRFRSNNNGGPEFVKEIIYAIRKNN